VQVLIIQAEEHDESNNVFNDIKSNNLRSLQIQLQRNPSLIHSRDAGGGTVFHAAYLYERYKICHWLVENFPREALHPYSQTVNLPLGLLVRENSKGGSSSNIEFKPLDTFVDADRLTRHTTANSGSTMDMFTYTQTSMKEITKGFKQVVKVPEHLMPYAGENILHMVIIRRNLEETRWLLDFYKNHQFSVPGGLYALLNSNAVGTMFDPRGNLYFGGYPLHFAVCCNDINIFDMVLSFSSSVVKNQEEKRRLQAQREAMDAGPAVLIKETHASRFHLNSNKVLPLEADEAKEDHLGTDNGSPAAGANNRIEFKYTLPPCDDEIYKCDHNGNNALHFCVIHGLKEMYVHIKKTVIRLIKRELKIAIANFRKAACATGKLVLDSPFDGPIESITCYPPVQTAMDLTRDMEINDDWIESKAFIKLNERMLQVLNKDYHSPSTLAADYTVYSLQQFTNEFEAVKVDVLNEILEGDLLVRWKYGPIVANSIDLQGFDIQYDRKRYQLKPIPTHAQMHGVIEWLCISDSEQGLEIPVVQQFIGKKWKLVGLRIFFRRFFIHLVFTFFMTVIAFHPYNVPFEKFSVQTNRWVTIAYLVNCAIVASYVMEDVPRMLQFRIIKYFTGVRGAAKLDRLLRVVMIASFVITVWSKVRIGYLTSLLYDHQLNQVNNDGQHTGLFYCSTNSNPDPVCYHQKITVIFISLCGAISWIYFFFFFLAFEKVAPFLLIIFRILQNDFAYFFRFYSIIVLSFGVATSTLSNIYHDDNGYGVYRCGLAMWVLLQNTVNYNNVNIDVINDDAAYYDLKWLMEFYNISFFVFVVLMLVNLLIGMIGNTYSAYMVSQKGLVLMEQYNIMCGMERNLSLKQKQESMSKYSSDNRQETNRVFPNPQYQYQQLDKSWSSAPTEEETTSNAPSKDSMIALLIINAQVCKQ
jgi:hypothetical protein